MMKVVLDCSTWAKFQNLTEPQELCDESGRVLGYFTPASEESVYDRVAPPVSEEELDRREAEGGGRVLADILADLAKRA